ncbi:MAG: tetratricopeptide (TPR) repeat protein [Myxococcota bacterium]
MIGLALLLSALAAADPLDLARQQSQSGQPEIALETLAPLLDTGSGEALALAGLIHESSGQLLLARQRLEAALASGDLADPGAAHLAMARCFQGTGDTARAIQHATAALATEDATRHDETLSLLIKLSVSMLGPAEAMALLSSALPPEALPETWSALAEGYLAVGMASAAVPPLQAAITAQPHSPLAPHWQTRIADAARKSGNTDNEVEALERLARDYTASSAWAEAHPEIAAETEGEIEARIRSAILRLHQDTQLTRFSRSNPSTQRLSRLVLAWLVRYPDHAAAGQIHDLYGELLMRTGRFSESHTQHMAAWDLTGEARHLHAAGFSASYSVKEAGSPHALEPQPLTPEAEALLTCADLYHHHFPATAEDSTLQLESANALIQLGRFREARARLMFIIDADPTTAIAEQAARTVLNTYLFVEDWKGIRATAERFDAQPGLSSPAFQTRLDEILAQTASLR